MSSTILHGTYRHKFYCTVCRREWRENNLARKTALQMKPHYTPFWNRLKSSSKIWKLQNYQLYVNKQKQTNCSLNKYIKIFCLVEFFWYPSLSSQKLAHSCHLKFLALILLETDINRIFEPDCVKLLDGIKKVITFTKDWHWQIDLKKSKTRFC